MRIVDVCAFYTPKGGGVRTYVEQKLRIGPELGHDITILAPGGAKLATWNEQHRAGYEVKPCDFRVLRFSGGKKGSDE